MGRGEVNKKRSVRAVAPLPHRCCPHTPVPPEASRETHHRRYAVTVTSPFLFTGTLLDPEGLYDEEVCTPDNLQKYAIPNPPTGFRQFLKKPVHSFLFNISQIEGCFMDCQKKPQPNIIFYSGLLGEEGKKWKEKQLLLYVQ